MTRELTADVAGPDHARQVAELYETYFDFVWRSLRRLGVAPARLEDALQDVFVVVHRRLGDFRFQSTVKSWLFGIALRVAKADRRRSARAASEVPVLEHALVGSSADPLENAAEAEAALIVEQLLDTLQEDRRAVFVMAELESFSAQEISEILGVGVNTVYSRLRLARRDFEAAVQRLHAREQWRTG